jgi:hypothetical protein
MLPSKALSYRKTGLFPVIPDTAGRRKLPRTIHGADSVPLGAYVEFVYYY